MSEPSLSERDVCTKLITPAVERAGWDIQSQVREEVSLTAGRVMVRGRLVARGKAKRADYVLYLKPNLPLAVIEAKEPSHRVGDGMQQALEYAEMLGMPRTRMLVSTTALTSARGTPDSLHGFVDYAVDMTIAPPIASTSHLVDENAQPHLRRHHSLEKLCLVLDGQRIDALLDCRQSTRHGR